MVRFEYVPCKSGSPHGVRGAVHFFAAVVPSAAGATRPAWAAAGPGARHASALTAMMTGNFACIPVLLSIPTSEIDLRRQLEEPRRKNSLRRQPLLCQC